MKSSRLLPWFRSWSRRVPILHGILIAQLIMLPSSTSRGVWVDVDSDGDGIFDTGYDDGTSPPDTTPPPEPDPIPDSDGDHLSDAEEAAAGSNPYSPDSDGDGITDADEVNLTGTNPTSADSDGDGISDYNEFYGNTTVDEDTSGPGETPYDYDGDGIADPVDPDPLSPQNDPDSDGDYVPDSQDSDPYNPAVWNDANDNGVNDDAEVPNNDTDGDGVSNDTDSHPADPTLYNDWNWNGQNDGDEDADGDGVSNLQDSHPNSNCLWCDWNGNGVNDDVEAGTADNDGDGHADNADSHPFNNSLWEDWNSNGWNDSAESVNSDGDTQPDFTDSDPQNASLWEDWNRNGSNDSTEPPPNPDRDNDLLPNDSDSDPDNSALWCDWNRNGINDTMETPPADSDGDSYPDSNDSDNSNANLWEDWNHNGYNDSVEGQYLDDDSDTHPNAFDTHPQDALLWSDHNGNGINDECEVTITDSDGDGYNDDLDTHPSNANLWNDHNDNGINDELELPPDRDGDSIADDQDEFPDDFDNDSLTDADEISRGSDPSSRDTDGDGLTDGEEVYAGTNLLNVDTDADGLTDFEELRAYQSDPLTATTITLTPPSNGALSNSSNNTSSISTPSATPISALKNYYKLKAAAAWSLTASMADDDGDRIPNAVEELYAPLIVTPEGDLDGDLVSNLQEYEEGTDLNGASAGDFDGDGISDVIEDSWWMCCSKYRFNDAYADPDGDGLLTIEELVCTHGGRSTIKGMVATSPIHQCSGPTSATTATTYNVVTRRMPGIKLGENPMMSWQNRASVYQQWMTDGTLRLAILDAQSRLQLTTAAQIVTFFTRDLLFSPASHSLYIPLVGYDHVPRGYLRWLENKGLATPPLGGSGAGILNSLDTSATTTASADIDGDGMPNFWEARYNLNFRSGLDANMVFKAAEGASDAVKALAAAKQARYKDEYGLIRAYPAVYAAGGFYNQTEWDILNRLDPDHDGLPNLLEYKLNANPLLADLSAVISRNTDTDGDGYDDIEELLLGTNPESASSNPSALNPGTGLTASPTSNTPPSQTQAAFKLVWDAPEVSARRGKYSSYTGTVLGVYETAEIIHYPGGVTQSTAFNKTGSGNTAPTITELIAMCQFPNLGATFHTYDLPNPLMQSFFRIDNTFSQQDPSFVTSVQKFWTCKRARVVAQTPDSSNTWTAVNVNLMQGTKVTCLRTKTTTRPIPLASITQVLGNYTFTIPAGDCKSEVFPTMLSFPLLHPADSDTPGSVTYSLLPIEIDSRDRAVEGFIPNIDPSKPMKLGFSSGGKSYGTYEIPQSGSSSDVHVYNSVDDIFSDSEAEQYKNGSLSPKAWQQQVVLVREGTGVRFYTVADNLSEFKVTLYSGNQQIGEVKHQLTEDKDFGRVIAAANGFIKGDAPPRITGWSSFPTDITTEPPPVPALTAGQLGDVLASAPASVASNYSSAASAAASSTTTQATATSISANWQTDRYQFAGFVLDVKNVATQSEWVAFAAQLQQIGYDPAPLLSNSAPAGAPLAAAPAAGAGGAAYSNPAPGQSRNGLTMPSEISNRGLVSKALMWIIKKTVLTQAAVGEGVIFGMWDGIKGDVEGVVDLLTLQPLRDFIQFVKDPYRAAGELYKIFRYLKDNGWDGVKAAATSMLQEFMGQQQARLECILGAPDVEDPTYLNAYLAGYAVGFIGEQVVVAVFTAGVGKVGWIAKAFEMGSGAATKVLQLAGNIGSKMHKASKGFFGDIARVGRSADEIRATRRSSSLCGSVTGCLAAGTLVLMADGSYQPIQNIRHNASVIADDPYDNEPPKPARVRSQIETHNTTLLDILYGDTATLTCTVEHPFYAVNRGWVMATDLRSGDQFIAPDAQTFTVNSVTERSGQFTTYNLDVDGPDTFFVTPSSSAPPILTHNLQGEEGMYGYLPASGQIGISQAFTPTGVPRLNPDGTPLMMANPQHHFYFDAGIKANFTDAPLVFTHPAQTRPVATVFPSIELTHEQHVTAHMFGDSWLTNNGYPRAMQMTRDDWLRLYGDGKWNDLAEEMVRGANTKGAGITPNKIARLKNACAGRLTEFNRRKSCAGL